MTNPLSLSLALGVLFCGFDVLAGAGNPMDHFRDEDAVAYSNCVRSLKNVQSGELYTMTWDVAADYHLDRLIAANCTSCMGSIGWLCTNVLDHAPVPPVVTGVGCSAFATRNAAGHHLVGRNFDYRYPMTHALVYVPANAKLDRPYASVSSVDCGWLGYDIGQLDDGTSDLSYAALLPHIPLDGMNEKGVMVTVLSLDARKDGPPMTEQFYPDRNNATPSLAMRYLLDHADSTEAGINLMTNRFNMFFAIGGSIPIKANYHFLVCDKSGDARVVEWLQPADGRRNWTTWVTNATAVSNFYLNDGYGHGSNRWEILRHALARQNDRLEEFDAMNLARAVAQRKGADQTSWTHWSIIYDLDTLSAKIATLGNFDEIFQYRLQAEDWIDAPVSARPTVRTDLPLFPKDPTKAVSSEVYLLPDPITGSSGAPSSYAGASVAAVNRMGLTYDASAETLHVVATNRATAIRNALYYVDLSSRNPAEAAASIVAGVNINGLAARVVKFRNSTGPGDVSPSILLMNILDNCGSIQSAEALMRTKTQSAGGCGIVVSDAMGNVKVWGPAGAELETDDASEMVKYSLDLRKGIYEVDGVGRGEFDELPGLLRLASTDTTRAIVSMDYAHLDVFLPNETNVARRIAIPDAPVVAYSVLAEPTVPHATYEIKPVDGHTEAVRNNRGQLVADRSVQQKVIYTTEKDYYFPDGSTVWEKVFDIAPTLTIVPTPPMPVYQRPPDYASADGNDWLYHHDIPLKRYYGEPTNEADLDLFFLYPTSVQTSNVQTVDGVCDIDNADLRGFMGAPISFYVTGSVFGDFTRVYVPYYRQTPVDVETEISHLPDCHHLMRQKWFECWAYTDVTNALTHYFTVINPNGKRPFILSGHSHGSGMLSLLMEHFFAENATRKGWLKNMVACYAVGWGIGQDLESAFATGAGISVAKGATDTGVYIFWNTYGGPDPSPYKATLFNPENPAAPVNPILWTRATAAYAPASLNLGGWIVGQLGATAPHLYNASNNVACGTIVCTAPELAGQVIEEDPGYGRYSLHSWDYRAYWENVRKNAFTRYMTFANLKEVVTNGLPAVADASVEVKVKGGEGEWTDAVLSPIDGKLYASAASKEVKVVYTIDAGATSRRFVDGESVSTLEMRLDEASGSWLVKASASEVEQRTKTGEAQVVLGVVAQRYPWNGMLDISYTTPYVNASKTVVFSADGIELGTSPTTAGRESTVSFDLRTVASGTFAEKRLSSLKLTATLR